MIHVEGIYQDGTEDSAEHLGNDIWNDVGPGEAARKGKSERYRRVEVGAGIRACDQHAGHYGETPGEGYHYPSGTVCLCSFKAACSAHSVSEKDQNHGAYELENAF